MEKIPLNQNSIWKENKPLIRDGIEIGELSPYLMHLQEGLDDLCNTRRETVQQLNDVADELDKMARDIQITNAASAAGGVISIGLTIAGFVGAFVTFGASIPLGISGAVLGSLSAITATSANVIDKLISKRRQSEINAVLRKDRETLEKYVVDHNLRIDSERLKYEDDVINGISAVGMSSVVATSAGNVAVTILRGAGKAVAICGLVFCMITLPIDIGILVKNSININKGKPHELAQYLREICRVLTVNVKEDILPLLDKVY